MYDNSVKGIMKLAFPVMIGAGLHSVMMFADRFFIASLGIKEAAGSSLSGAMIWVLITFTTIISGGTVALVARKIGEKNEAETRSAAEQSILLAIGFSLIMTFVTYTFSPHIFAFFGAEPDVEAIGISYFRILTIGFPFMMSSMIMGSIFQAAGDTKTPMMIFSVMSLLNLLLDPIFIFGYGPVPFMGVDGAAYATVTAEVVASILVITKLYRFKKILIGKFYKIRPDFSMIKRILKIGLWTGLNSFSRPLSATFLQKVLTFHGTGVIAAFSFGIQWLAAVFVFMDGLRVAITTLVGQSLGRKDVSGAEKAVKNGLWFGFGVMAFFMAFFMIFADNAISVFTSDKEVIEFGANYLRIVFLGILFEVPMAVYGSAFNGSGDTMPPMLIAFIANWPGKIGFAYVAAYILGYGSNSAWWAINVSLVMEGVMMAYWYSKGKWKEKKV